MADIWLTAAAQDAYSELLAAAPAQAEAVSEAINDITAHPGRPINLPGSPPAEPFLANEPRHPDAPAVIYRRSTPGEQGDWLVVSLMKRANYRAAREAQQALANYPPSVQSLIEQVAHGAVTTGRLWHEPSASAETHRKSSTITADPDHGNDVPTPHAMLNIELESDQPSPAAKRKP